MDVVLGVRRKVEVHDTRNRIHVDPTSGHVGGHEYPHTTRTERCEGLLAV
jgi:hypothetical protein